MLPGYGCILSKNQAWLATYILELFLCLRSVGKIQPHLNPQCLIADCLSRRIASANTITEHSRCDLPDNGESSTNFFD